VELVGLRMIIKTYIVTAKDNPDLWYEVDAPSKRVAKWCAVNLYNQGYYGKRRTIRDFIARREY
jgi:hypothetical protein